MCSFTSCSGDSVWSAQNPVLANGAQIIVQTLLELGVDTIFGYSGAKVLPLFDALYVVSGGQRTFRYSEEHQRPTQQRPHG